MVLHSKSVDVDESMMEMFDIKQLNELMAEDGREPLTTENLGFIIEVVDDDDDEHKCDWEAIEIEEEIIDFVYKVSSYAFARR